MLSALGERNRQTQLGSRCPSLRPIERWCAQHTAIAEQLEQGNLSVAADLLEEHWLSCIEPVGQWLKSRFPASHLTETPEPGESAS